MNDLFFYLSKIIWMLITPGNLFLLLLSLSSILLLTRYKRFARKSLLLLLMIAWMVAIFPVGSWLFYPLERQFAANPQLPDKVDGIIVLGGSVIPSLSQYWQQLQTNNHHERLSTFIHLAKRYPEARLVFTGGSASIKPDQPTEADQVADFFINSDIPEQRLILEKQSRNTYENATYSKQLAKPAAGENWILITTAFHMPRSVGVFCHQQWPVIPYPVDHQSHPERLYNPGLQFTDHASNLETASHEWIGLLAYYLTGKTNSLLPTSC